MVNALAIKNKIENKVFNALGSTATISYLITSSTDKWGDTPETYETPVNVTTVPWSVINSAQDFQQFGDLEKGELDMAFTAGTTVNVGDKVTYNTKLYKVKVVEYYPLKDVNLVKVARLKEFL